VIIGYLPVASQIRPGTPWGRWSQWLPPLTTFTPCPSHPERSPSFYRAAIDRFAPLIWLIAPALVVVACSGQATEVTEAKAPATGATTSVVSATTAVGPAASTSRPPATTPTAPPPATEAPGLTATTTSLPEPIPVEELELVAFAVPAGSRPHDVAPAVDGGVWYTAQGSGDLGWLDPDTGETRLIPLGAGSRPHGVIVGADDAPWITDGGLNAIVRVDPATDEVVAYPLPDDRPDANLNTAAFDGLGRLWFTGQNGVHGVLDPATGTMVVFDSPRGRGPYGITATPSGEIYYASLAGSYVGEVAANGSVVELEPPTPDQGARRVWADSAGSIWVSEWNSGQLSRYEPAAGEWTTWRLPGEAPQAYAVYVDDTSIVWVSDFGGNALHRFDPFAETFHTFELPSDPSNVRQILGRPGEVWAPESAADQLIVIRRAEG
jgi:virginiamycin B lyase